MASARQYRRCCGPNVVLNGGSPPRRSRRGQGDGERVTAQNHKCDQPPDGALAVVSAPISSGNVADGPPSPLMSGGFLFFGFRRLFVLPVGFCLLVSLTPPARQPASAARDAPVQKAQ